MSSSNVTLKVCCNEYKGTQLPLAKWVTAPTPICCASLIDCTVFLCWRVTHCFFYLFFFFTFLSYFFFLYFVSVQCCLLQKWGLVNIAVSDVASCLAVFVSLSLSLHAFILPAGFSFLLLLIHFLPLHSISVYFLFVGLFELFWGGFSCHFSGSQSWGCLSCLSVTGRYTCQSVWLTALINLYPGSAYAGHGNNISAPKWTLHLTLCVSFLLPRQLSALAELLRIEFMGMEHYYSFCCA